MFKYYGGTKADEDTLICIVIEAICNPESNSGVYTKITSFNCQMKNIQYVTNHLMFFFLEHGLESCVFYKNVDENLPIFKTKNEIIDILETSF